MACNVQRGNYPMKRQTLEKRSPHQHMGDGATLICSGIGFLALSKAAKPSAQEEDAKKSANCIKSSSELLPADTA